VTAPAARRAVARSETHYFFAPKILLTLEPLIGILEETETEKAEFTFDYE
jgi:hypothetical protein